MSQVLGELLAVYVDGETKTGKGAAGQAIAQALRDTGLKVYYDVAGDFYRRYVAMVRCELQLDEAADLPTGSQLETVAHRLYATGQAFQLDDTLGDLQRPAISESVAILGELATAQKAGAEWFGKSLERAAKSGADVMVLDGRNPRRRIADQLPHTTIKVKTALDLYMTCSPDEAARRILLSRGLDNASPDELAEISQDVTARRNRDRNRQETPFLQPAESLTFTADQSTAAILQQSFDKTQFHDVPATIIVDNTDLTKPEMLALVSRLASEAVKL